MKVFLTGATGFLGAEIARDVVLRGHDCAVLTRRDIAGSRLAPIADRLSVVPGDFFDPASYREGLARFAPDALLHCGWWGVAGADRNDLRQLDNVAAAGRLAQAAIDCGATTIVGVGSQAEYGPKQTPIGEDDAAEPTTLYGVAKLAACWTFVNLGATQGVRAVWGRVFSLYGPGDEDGPWLIPSLIRALRAGEAPRLTGCEQHWEFTHVRDAARAFVRLLETPQATGVYNVASGAPRPLRDVVLALRDLVAPKIEPRFGGVPYRPDQVMRLEGRIDRIRAATGWRPEVSLESGIAETVAAFATRDAA
jgi:nucleoside-diphosphate-sugar epimerase